MKRTLIFLIFAMTVLLGFTACSDPNAEVLEYAMIATGDDLSQLDDFPNLEYVDLRGSTCYDAIDAYVQSHPQVRVRYNVSLGKEDFNNNSEELELRNSDFDYNLLMQNLKYLPELKRIHFDKTELTSEQLTALQNAYPNVSIEYTVEFNYKEYDSTATEIDLSFLQPHQVDEAAALLNMLPKITTVHLMDSDGRTDLSLDDVRKMADSTSDLFFEFEFKLFGKTVTTSDTALEYDKVSIGNDGIAQIRSALDLMPQCTYVKLDDCNVDNEVMAQLRDDYPDTKVVWRVFIGSLNLLTDEEMVRLPFGVNNTTVQVLQYCTDVKYLDVTGNGNLTDISFAANMPNLECAILSMNSLSDLTPLASCPNLTWLELALCGSVNDISCLSQLTNLKYLNLSYTKVTDLSPLEDLPLELLMCIVTPSESADEEAFAARHPNCVCTFTGESAFGYGWRYTDFSQTMHPYFAKIYPIFRYGESGYYGNRKGA